MKFKGNILEMVSTHQKELRNQWTHSKREPESTDRGSIVRVTQNQLNSSKTVKTTITKQSEEYQRKQTVQTARWAFTIPTNTIIFKPNTSIQIKMRAF